MSRPASTPGTRARASARRPKPQAALAPGASVRGTLSRERIAAAALALIDAHGLDALSLRAIGAALGCEAMSLYRHVADKDDLLDAVVDRIFEAFPLPEIGSAPPRRLMRRIADDYRRIGRAHPLAFPLLTNRRFNSPATLRVLERILAVLKAAGLDARARARAFRAIGFFLNGLGLAEGAVLAIGTERRPTVMVNAAPQDFPLTRASARWLGPDGLDAAYEAGIEALLDRVLGSA
jgi:AcrR family transcriptional regulator